MLIIIAGSALSSFQFLSNFRKEPEGAAYGAFRRQLGRSIILGLEFLIAGDIIRTVIVADTLTNVAHCCPTYFLKDLKELLMIN